LKTLRDIGEDALIERLIRLVPRDGSPLAGPGDDCAVIDDHPESPHLLLLKTDALVANVHFVESAPAFWVGWKSAARVVSDFAAMGGYPERFLVTLALPSKTAVAWVEDLYRGIGACLEKFGGTLAGGETSSVPDGAAAVISIAATGRVARANLVLRSTGCPGDLIFVTGRLGGSIRGKHLDFTPRLREASWLVSHYKPTAMMDLSDGLAKDLPRMAVASGCGFRIDENLLPLTEGCTPAQALGDGEDFEILFSICPTAVPHMQAEWADAFPALALTQIGELVELSCSPSLAGGWEHFKSSESRQSHI
jgi:thiamine-monophosphate kinase